MLSSNAFQVLRAETGSLVIWTRMSNELFQSKDFFLNKLKLFLSHFIQHSGLQITDMYIDVKVQISGKLNYCIFVKFSNSLQFNFPFPFLQSVKDVIFISLRKNPYLQKYNIKFKICLDSNILERSYKHVQSVKQF